MRRWKLFALFLVASCVVSQPARASSSAKPIIGINVDVDEGVSKDASVLGPYYEAIEKSGGIPVLIPPMPEEDLRTLLKTLDGVMLIGGWDYPPDFYGQKVHPSDHVMEPRRANFDKLLIKTLVKDTELPVLGICAGSQILNIAQGGDLIQDIPSAKPESKVSHRHHMENGVNKHIVVFTPGTKLAALYTVKELSVPAAHHQAVDKIGAGLTKAAQSEDGVTEAVEMDSKPFVIGVQYHPERDYDNNKALFAAFIEQAKHGSNTKAFYLIRNILKGSVITAADVQERDISAFKAPQDKVDDPANGIGRTAKNDIAAGSVLVQHDLGAPAKTK